jgi:hypothetical protein
VYVGIRHFTTEYCTWHYQPPWPMALQVSTLNSDKPILPFLILGTHGQESQAPSWTWMFGVQESRSVIGAFATRCGAHRSSTDKIRTLWMLAAIRYLRTRNSGSLGWPLLPALSEFAGMVNKCDLQYQPSTIWRPLKMKLSHPLLVRWNSGTDSSS